MNLRRAPGLLPVLFLSSSLTQISAGTLSLLPTPILKAAVSNLSVAEFSTNGGASWISTGFILAGSSTTNSLRLDGFPEQASYRFAPAGSGSIVTPAVSFGAHLRAAFPGAGEVRVESLNQLGAADWTNRAFVFPNLQGEFIAPLRPGFTTNAEFSRAVQPATSLTSATVTYYSPDTNATAAGYGLVADDMPPIYGSGYIAAPCPAVFNRGGANAAGAGESYELVGPQGKATVIVADLANDVPPGTCDAGRYYFDIGTAAFTNLFTPDVGIGPATYRLVPTPVEGNIKLVCVINSGGFYTEFRPYNHRAGVDKFEVQAASNGPWTELPRTTYNSFVYNSGTPLTFPLNTRITSRFGEVVTFPAIPSLTTGSRFTANGQFTTFPDQGPTPIWLVPPVYSEGFSSNHIGLLWQPVSANYNAFYTGSAYQGNYSLRVTNLAGFGTLNLLASYRFPKPSEGFLEFAARSEGTTITSLTLQIRGYDTNGAAAQTSLPLPPLDNTWRVLRIPLDAVAAPAQINGLLFQNFSAQPIASFNLDTISFRW